MAAIGSLLNPIPDKPEHEAGHTSNTRSVTFSPDIGTPVYRHKKQKLCKDAAVFTRGPIRGECRYPPHEDQDDLLAAQHQQFELFPMGEIVKYPRHIPYNSEKKSLLEKTNRECLEGEPIA